MDSINNSKTKNFDLKKSGFQLFSGGGDLFAYGGNTYPDGGMTGMMKARMALANEFGNKSAQRMVSPNLQTYTFNGSENTNEPIGQLGTHYMGSYDNIARPSIQDINGKLEFTGFPSSRSNEDIRFDRPEDAEYFAEHYKEIAPMMKNDKFAYGGNIKGNNPLTEFNSGQSHERNPNGGVMQGTGANGKPNLVEEGETKHEDYIFSDRLTIDPQISKEFKLPKGLNGKTFAQASKHLNKEAKDRPNDPISKNGVKAQLAKLTAAQEGLKAKMQPQQGIPIEGQPNANMLAQGYANGGFIDQTHYQNPTLQGANMGAEGMPLTKLNTPLVGIDQNAYARSMKLQGVD